MKIKLYIPSRFHWIRPWERLEAFEDNMLGYGTILTLSQIKKYIRDIKKFNLYIHRSNTYGYIVGEK